MVKVNSGGGDSIVEDSADVNGQSRKRKYLVLDDDNNSSVNNSKNFDVEGSRVLILPYGSVRCNKHIVELIDIVKPLIRQLVDDTNMVPTLCLFFKYFKNLHIFSLKCGFYF